MSEHFEASKLKAKEELKAKYEQEIIDAIKKLPLEQKYIAIALNNYCLKKKKADEEQDNKNKVTTDKYTKLQLPSLQANNEIISGKRAPTEAEIKQAKEHLTEEEKGKIAESLTAEPISEYWLKAMTSCLKLKPDIYKDDEPLLKKVTSIEYLPEEGTHNFTIRFHFAENEYFENENLSVRFVMFDENEVEKTEGTEIKWKEGKDITKKTVNKKQTNKKTGKSRTISKVVDAESFFTFFKSVDPKPVEEDEEDEEDMEDENIQRISINYSIAVNLQEEIIPYHLEYYLGTRTGAEGDEADEEFLGGMDEDDDEDEDGDGEGEGEGDDDDEDEDEDEEEKPRKKGNKKQKETKKEGGESGTFGQKQDCKQQ